MPDCVWLRSNTPSHGTRPARHVLAFSRLCSTQTHEGLLMLLAAFLIVLAYIAGAIAVGYGLEAVL